MWVRTIENERPALPLSSSYCLVLVASPFDCVIAKHRAPRAAGWTHQGGVEVNKGGDITCSQKGRGGGNVSEFGTVLLWQVPTRSLSRGGGVESETLSLTLC